MINNWESPSFEKTKDLSSIDTSLVEQSHIKIQSIREMELADNEDNHVTIPDDLKDFFWDELSDNNELISKIEEFKQGLYEKLWLNENLEQNTDIQKFEKWLVDWLLVENIEMLDSLLDSLLDKWIDEVVTMIENLANWDVIVAIVKDVFYSFWDILNTFQNPYEWWLSLWWLWLWVIWKWMKWLKIADKLYSDSKYTHLEKHKDILWENPTIDDIVWEWTQALIIKHPTNESLVVKVAKEGKVDDITQEFNNHKLFYDTWEEWIINWDLSDKVRIPQIFEWKTDWYFLMEKIEWQSLYSKTLIERFENKLTKKDKDIIWTLSDKQVRELLKDKYEATDWYLDMLIEDYSVEHLADQLWTSYNYRRTHWKIWDTPLSDTLDYLRNKWVSHNDLHPWNIMLDNKWNIYIIDFWRIK